MISFDRIDNLMMPLEERLEVFYLRTLTDSSRSLSSLLRAKNALNPATFYSRKYLAADQLYDNIVARIAKLSGYTEEDLRQIFKRAGFESMKDEQAMIGKLGLEVPELATSDVLTGAINAVFARTNSVVQNLTRSIAYQGQTAFIAAADDAFLAVATGTMSIDQAIKQGVLGLVDNVLKVVNPNTGRQEQMDVAIKRNVWTGINQATGDMTLAMAAEVGTDYVEVSAHPGARNKGAGPMNHASWQGKVYSISGKDAKYEALIPTTGYGTGAGLLGYNCVLGGTHVTFARVSAAYRREYSGEVIVIRTSGENELTVTPNHPILTTKGWVAAGSLREGDDVICRAALNGDNAGSPQVNQDQPTISEVFSALSEVGIVSRLPVSSGDFHGDASDGEVDVVLPNSFLNDGVYTSGNKKIVKLPFSFTPKSGNPLPPERAFYEVALGSNHPSYGIVGRGGESGSFIGGHSGEPFTHGGGTVVSDGDADFSEILTDSAFGNACLSSDFVLPHSRIVHFDEFVRSDAEFALYKAPTTFTHVDPVLFKVSKDKSGRTSVKVSDGLYSSSVSVTIDSVISVSKKVFIGQVYNLSTEGEWYSANNIITHNCRHSLFLHFPGFEQPNYTQSELDRMNNTTVTYNGKQMDLYEATQQQRYLERGVRDWKRKQSMFEAAGLGEEYGLAGLKIKDWQEKLRDFTKQTGLERRYEWERIYAK